MEYIKLNEEEAEKMEQDMYKYMPTIVIVDDHMMRVVAQNNGKVYVSEV